MSSRVRRSKRAEPSAELLSAPQTPAPVATDAQHVPPAPAPARAGQRERCLDASMPDQPGQPSELRVLERWPARLLLELPAGWTLLCSHEQGRRFLVTTRQSVYAAARRRGESVMHGEHWLALLEAAGQQRACLALGQWLTPSFPPPRLHGPFDLPPQPLLRALGPQLELEPVRELSVREVLAHFGAVLEQLDPDGSPPSPDGSAPSHALTPELL